MKYLILKISIAVILLNGMAYCTTVSGDVWGVWSIGDSPYEVVGNLHVPQESTLVIELGCYIEFQGYYLFIVDTSATLQAIGTVSDSITFTAADTSEGWFGLRFLSASSNSEIAYCIVEWGKVGYNPFPEEYINGGGIYIRNTDMRITNSNIRHNKTLGGYGAGIYCNNSEVEIRYNNINNNLAWGGPAIWPDSSNVNITGNVIDSNIAYYPLGGEWGGGITCYDSYCLIDSNTIINNYSYFCAGGLFLDHSEAIVTNNIFLNNGAAWPAGGLLVYYSSATVAYNIFADNYSYYANGGAILNSASSVIAYNNTIVGNHAGNSGGGYLSSSNTDSLYNNIIVNNTAGSSPQVYCSDTTAITYSCIEGGWEGEGNIDADPLFVDPDNYDFNLSWDSYPEEDQYKSPCIDTGDPNSPLDPDSSHADMGALPFNRALVSIIDIANLPRMIDLSQNYPNPFNAATLIKYDLPQQSTVTIDIYDILGRKISTLYNGNQPAGTHQVIWDASDVASGVYFYKLQAGDYSESKKMMLVK